MNRSNQAWQDRGVGAFVLSACAEAINARCDASPMPEASGFSLSAWRDSVSTAMRADAAPLVGRWCIDAEPDIPIWVSRAFRAEFFLTERRTTWFVEEATRVVSALAEAGIPAMIRKGVHLSQIYPAAGARPFGDIDLLASADDCPGIESVLTACGYVAGRVEAGTRVVVPYDAETRRFFRIGTNALPTFSRPVEAPEVRVSEVDVAVSMFLPGSGWRLPFGDLYNRSVLVSGPLVGLGPVDLGLDLCANIFLTSTTLHYVWKHRYQRIVPYVDLLLLFRHLGVAPTALMDAAEAFGVGEPVAFALGNFAALFPGVVPNDFIADAVARHGGSTMLDRVGHLESREPLHWSSGVWERVFGDVEPEAWFPPSMAPID